MLPSQLPDVAPVPARRVLVIDDNRDFCDSLLSLLQAWGYEVCAAHDGEQGLDVCAKFQPDVLVLDVRLPGSSGVEVCNSVRSEPWGKTILVVGLTGDAAFADLQQGSHGFDHCLLKGGDIERLKLLIERVEQKNASTPGA